MMMPTMMMMMMFTSDLVSVVMFARQFGHTVVTESGPKRILFKIFRKKSNQFKRKKMVMTTIIIKVSTVMPMIGIAIDKTLIGFICLNHRGITQPFTFLQISCVLHN